MSEYQNTKTYLLKDTTENTVISPNFLVWKICGKAQFLRSFGQSAQNYAETVPFHKMFTPRNQVKLRGFLQWDILEIGLKKFLLLVKLKIQFRGLVISDLNGEPIAGTFYEKELQKANQNEYRMEKPIRRKGD